MIAEFKGDWTMMFCRSCVRFTENRRIPGKFICSDVNHKGELTQDSRACEYYWDKAEQEALDLENEAREERERLKRWEQNKENPPRPASWKRDWDEMRDCETGAMPFCPNCEEPLYYTEQCYFCGQRIEQDEKMLEWAQPPEEKRMDCFFCGAEGAMIYVESSYNGHKRGHCEHCGIQFIE